MSTDSPQKTPAQKKYYEIYEGENRIYCRGKWMIGAETKPVWLTILLINIPAILQEALVLPDYDGYGPLIAGICLHFLSNLCMFLAISTEPGIIRRNNQIYAPNRETLEIPKKNESPDQKVMFFNNNGTFQKVKYCYTCQIYKPPRTSHCHTCNNCVERFDHHCPWLGTCIGSRNYRYFFMFVTMTAALDLLCFGTSVDQMVIQTDALEKIGQGFGDYLKSEPYSIISAIYSGVFFFFIGGLFFFHCFLFTINKTTYEYLKNQWLDSEAGNPFKRKNCLKHCKIFCKPMRATFIKLKKDVFPVLEAAEETPKKSPQKDNRSPGEENEQANLTKPPSEIEANNNAQNDNQQQPLHSPQSNYQEHTRHENFDFNKEINQNDRRITERGDDEESQTKSPKRIANLNIIQPEQRSIDSYNQQTDREREEVPHPQVSNRLENAIVFKPLQHTPSNHAIYPNNGQEQANGNLAADSDRMSFPAFSDRRGA